MSKGDFLGEFEGLVLLALVRLGEQAYGMKIRQEIQRRTGRDVSIGSVYATLSRLEDKGFVESRTGDPTPERGGRAKRYFRVKGSGFRVLNQTDSAYMNMRAGLSSRLRPGQS